MIYREFQGKKLSQLGFGTMRLPTLENGAIDEKQTEEMVRIAIENGVNYFDTAQPYHGGMSEIVLGRALSRYPRESFFLADKFPGHQICTSYDPAGVFEEQLRKCGVEYFDFYLLHNVYENSIHTYLDPKWGIVDYFREQKRLGRIRHLGFSTHGGLDTMRAFLDVCGKDMEFCQIQLNWMDWKLQNAKEKLALLEQYGLPVIVMEPLRGGKLCAPGEENEAVLRALRPEESMPGWGFRFLQSLPVTVVLSGMSNLAQMQENLATFQTDEPVTPAEAQALFGIADGMMDAIPCTACRYCTEHCPMGLDIPMLLSAFNDVRFVPSFNVSMRVECLPEEKQPAACIGCGKCAKMCPQHIDIPAQMKAFAKKLTEMPSWTEICREREEAANRLRAAGKA